MRSCVILGSGRSGTSMLAGTLQRSGYYMGDELLAPTLSNPRGYFESEEINALNDELLAPVVVTRPHGRLRYFYPWRLSKGLLWLADIDVDVDVRPTHGQSKQISQLTSRKPFCFKDPRFCYTLGAWRPMLSEIVFLCVFREPGRTVSSMKKDTRERYRAFYLTSSRALRAWTSMYEHVLEKHSQKGEWLFAHYDQIVDGSAFPRIENVLNVKVDPEFVDASLKRSQDLGNVPLRTSQIYQRLCALAGYA